MKKHIVAFLEQFVAFFANFFGSISKKIRASFSALKKHPENSAAQEGSEAADSPVHAPNADIETEGGDIPPDGPDVKKRRSGLGRKGKSVIISLVGVFVVMITACFVTVNYYLNKINYSNDKGFAFTEFSYYVTTTEAPKVIVLPSGETIYLSNYKKINDTMYDLGNGRYATDDGIVYETDGTIILANGAMVRRDGSILLPNGTVIDNLGLIVLSTGRIMLADKSVVEASSLCVDINGSVSVITGGVLTATQAELDEAAAYNPSQEPPVEAATFFTAPPTTVPTTESTTAVAGTSPSAGVTAYSGATTAHSSTTTSHSSGTTAARSPDTTAARSPSTTAARSPGTTAAPAVVPTSPRPPVPETPEEASPSIDLSLETPAVKWEFSSNDALIDANLSKPVAYNSNVINYLIAGIDYGSTSFPYGRSDSMIIVSINTSSKSVKLISLSRAAYVQIYGIDLRTRLNSAHGIGGPAMMVNTIESNYKIKIDNYFTVGFDAFKTVVDIFGGIPVTLSSAEAEALKEGFIANSVPYSGAGSYTLNGDLTLRYVRLRSIDSDRERTARQRKVLEQMAQMASSMSLSQLSQLADTLLPYITTDMSKTSIVYNVTKLKTYLGWERTQYVIPHKSSSLMLSASGYEVILVNWPDEVAYLQKLIYDPLSPKFYTK